MNFTKNFIARIDTRSIVVIGLLFGSTWLAIIDERVRAAYFDLAQIGLGGYLAQLIPQRKHEQ